MPSHKGLTKDTAAAEKIDLFSNYLYNLFLFTQSLTFVLLCLSQTLLSPPVRSMKLQNGRRVGCMAANWGRWAGSQRATSREWPHQTRLIILLLLLLLKCLSSHSFPMPSRLPRQRGQSLPSRQRTLQTLHPLRHKDR